MDVARTKKANIEKIGNFFFFWGGGGGLMAIFGIFDIKKLFVKEINWNKLS